MDFRPIAASSACCDNGAVFVNQDRQNFAGDRLAAEQHFQLTGILAFQPLGSAIACFLCAEHLSHLNQVGVSATISVLIVCGLPCLPARLFWRSLTCVSVFLKVHFHNCAPGCGFLSSSSILEISSAQFAMLSRSDSLRSVNVCCSWFIKNSTWLRSDHKDHKDHNFYSLLIWEFIISKL